MSPLISAREKAIQTEQSRDLVQTWEWCWKKKGRVFSDGRSVAMMGKDTARSRCKRV